MNRFIIMFKDNRPPVGLNTMPQVTTYLARSVPDVSQAFIYEIAQEAVRTGWMINPVGVKNGATRGRPPGTTSQRKLFNNAPNAQKPWSPSDSRACLTMRKEGKPVKVIAKQLGRTTASISNYIQKHTLR